MKELSSLSTPTYHLAKNSWGSILSNNTYPFIFIWNLILFTLFKRTFLGLIFGDIAFVFGKLWPITNMGNLFSETLI